MSEHNIENSYTGMNFFDIYKFNWIELNREDIKNIINKIELSNSDLLYYINDVDVRCTYEQKIRDNLYKDIINNNLEYEIKSINNQLCRLDLNILNVNKENLINYLLILSNIMKENKKFLNILRNN